MKLVPMRFKGVQWHHNPKELVFECDKTVKELNSPNGTSYIQNMGIKNMIISGTGELEQTALNSLKDFFRFSDRADKVCLQYRKSLPFMLCLKA